MLDAKFVTHTHTHGGGGQPPVLYRMTGKLAWLTNSTCPDLSYTALEMSKKNNSAKIKDLRDIP